MILAVLQARMSSSRLPGKVLKPMLGRPMLGRQIDRIRRSRRLGRLVVATSREPTDDPVAQFCAAEGVACHRGSLNDVLARFHGAAEEFGPADHVVRLTADCPLADWTVIDDAVALHQAEGADLTGNGVDRTYPDGLDVEVLRRSALDRAHREATSTHDREHVTPYIYAHPQLFRIAHLKQAENLAALRWTVDNADDFRMVETVFARLLADKPDAVQADILEFLARHPDVSAINAPASEVPA